MEFNDFKGMLQELYGCFMNCRETQGMLMNFGTLLHILGKAIRCLFDKQHLHCLLRYLLKKQGCQMASVKNSSCIPEETKKYYLNVLLFRKDCNPLCIGVPLPTKSKRAPFEMGPYCHMRQKDLSLDLGV